MQTFFYKSTAGSPHQLKVYLHPAFVNRPLRTRVGIAIKPIPTPYLPGGQTIRASSARHFASIEITTGKGLKLIAVQVLHENKWKTFALAITLARPQPPVLSTAPDNIFPIRDFGQRLKLPRPSLSPKVSVIIPVFNQWAFSRECLASLIENEPELDYEVVLADDLSSDETIHADQSVDNVIVSRTEKNLRFVRNCNLAAKKARGEYLFFLNNDAQVQRKALSYLVDAFEARPRAGIIGSKLVYPDGRLQEAGGIVWSDGTAANYGNKSSPDLPGFTHPRQVDYVSGAALMIRNHVWQRLGGFDDRYAPAYYEDTDLCMAARAIGLEVWLEPSSVVVHYEGVSNGTSTSSGLKAYQVRNREVFFDKWKRTLMLEHNSVGTLHWGAAERPHNRICILVIDHYVPTPDQDAGSACTVHYLVTLSMLGYRVVFMGENFVRSEPYTRELEKHGIEVWVGNWFANNWKSALQERAKHFDMVVFNRPHITLKFIRDVRALVPHARLVYFGHDLHFLREERAANLLPPGLEKDSKIAKAKDFKAQEAEIYGQVHAALTISTDESNLIADVFQFKDTKVFPGYTYPIRDARKPPQTDVPTVLFVGGFNHEPNRDGVEWFLDNVWPIVRTRVSDARFWIVGSKMPDSYKHLGSGIEALGRLDEKDLSQVYSSSHAVVVPLRFGAGLKGKIVQAMAEGIPIVTTTVGAEGMPGEVKDCLAPCDSASDFADRVALLCTDVESQLKQSAKLLALSHRFYSRAASLNFFRNFVEGQMPPTRWLGGLSKDGWIGDRAVARLSAGMYRLQTWCPSMHFLKCSEPVVGRVYVDGIVVGEWRHHGDDTVGVTFFITQPKDCIISVSRTTIPKDIGSGDDERTLGLRFLELNFTAEGEDSR